MAASYSATKSQGMFICTTPYHGYIEFNAFTYRRTWDKP